MRAREQELVQWQQQLQTQSEAHRLEKERTNNHHQQEIYRLHNDIDDLRNGNRTLRAEKENVRTLIYCRIGIISRRLISADVSGDCPVRRVDTSQSLSSISAILAVSRDRFRRRGSRTS
jgi:hypothetical protein